MNSHFTIIPILLGLVACAQAQSKVAQDLDRLADRATQAILPRFADVDDARFGMMRAVTDGKHKLTYLGPANPRQDGKVIEFPKVFLDLDSRAASFLSELRNKKCGVGFYTVGLGAERRYRGPGMMLEHAPVPPKVGRIRSQLDSVRLRPIRQDRAFQVDGWTFYVRPVNATKEQCINCHAGQDKKHPAFHVGKPIGALVIAVKD